MVGKTQKAFGKIRLKSSCISVVDDDGCFGINASPDDIIIFYPTKFGFDEVRLSSLKEVDELIEALQTAKKAKWGDE